jgi:hypothetical protein
MASGVSRLAGRSHSRIARGGVWTLGQYWSRKVSTQQVAEKGGRKISTQGFKFLNIGTCDSKVPLGLQRNISQGNKKMNIREG